MTPTVIATLILAGVAILGSITSVLLLSYRVGRFTGVTETRISAGEVDRSKIWRVVESLADMLHKHLEGHKP